MDEQSVTAWLNRYIQAWRTYDPQAIADLFSENAVYYFNPYGQPIRGRDAIVADWLKNPDNPDTWDAEYKPYVVSGDTAASVGYTRYYDKAGGVVAREFNNIFLLRFDANGRCSEYRDHYVERPK